MDTTLLPKEDEEKSEDFELPQVHDNLQLEKDLEFWQESEHKFECLKIATENS